MFEQISDEVLVRSARVGTLVLMDVTREVVLFVLFRYGGTAGPTPSAPRDQQTSRSLPLEVHQTAFKCGLDSSSS